MYKTMIIDDDAVVRERLKDMIDWQGLSLELVCEAGDSDTEIEMYFLYRPIYRAMSARRCSDPPPSSR